MTYIVYILETERNTYYTGITTDLNRRLAEHNGKGNKGAKYTKANPVKTVLYTETLATRSLALIREAEIKKLTKIQKTSLINKSQISKAF
jgi:putative endonuclease